MLASLLTTARALAIHAGVFIALGGIQIVATALIMLYATRYKDAPCPVHLPRQPAARAASGAATSGNESGSWQPATPAGHGKDINDVWVDAVMTTRPALITTTSIHHAAKVMTARHFRHLPVAGDAGLLGVVDITDVCQALITAGKDDRSLAADPDGAARPGSRAHDRRPASARPPALPCPETQNDSKPHSPAYRATPTLSACAM
jgi:CBS domain protein